MTSRSGGNSKRQKLGDTHLGSAGTRRKKTFRGVLSRRLTDMNLCTLCVLGGVVWPDSRAEPLTHTLGVAPEYLSGDHLSS